MLGVRLDPSCLTTRDAQALARTPITEVSVSDRQLRSVSPLRIFHIHAQYHSLV